MGTLTVLWLLVSWFLISLIILKKFILGLSLEKGVIGAAASHLVFVQFGKWSFLWVDTVHARIHSLARGGQDFAPTPWPGTVVEWTTCTTIHGSPRHYSWSWEMSSFKSCWYIGHFYNLYTKDVNLPYNIVSASDCSWYHPYTLLPHHLLDSCRSQMDSILHTNIRGSCL